VHYAASCGGLGCARYRIDPADERHGTGTEQAHKPCLSDALGLSCSYLGLARTVYMHHK